LGEKRGEMPPFTTSHHHHAGRSHNFASSLAAISPTPPVVPRLLK
jgi:hypothetical protein